MRTLTDMTHAHSAAAPDRPMPALAELQETLDALVRDGHGTSSTRVHPPYIDTSGSTPRIRFRIHCTNATCGTYVEDSDSQGASDYLCDDCLDLE